MAGTRSESHPARALRYEGWDLKTRWQNFFYQEETPFGIALIRIVLPVVLLFVMVNRWFWARELYSADGATAQLSISYGYGNLLPEFSGEIAVALMSLLVFTLITMSLGFCTRVSVIISGVLYFYFNMLDQASTLTKYSVIVTHVMLLLSLSNCGAVWSIDSWLKRNYTRNFWPGESAYTWPKFTVWPRRLIQLLIGIVYIGAAFTKIHTTEFFNGEQMRAWMITNYNHYNPVGEILSLFPYVLVIFAYITIVWEILFIFLCWRGFSRMVMLALGVIFHLMTALTLGLYIFPAICITIYFAFLNEDDVQYFSCIWRKMSRRYNGLTVIPEFWTRQFNYWGEKNHPPVPAAVVFGISGLFVMFTGVEAEYHLDVYGERRPEGRYTLKEVSHEQFQAMTGPIEPIREEDKFYSLTTGNLLLGKILVDNRRNFQQGQRMIAQCTLNPPHEDMWIECLLLDGEDRIVARQGRFAPRKLSYINYAFQFSDTHKPGPYYVVLKSRKQEILRRSIRLNSGGSQSTPLAN